ncbi:hypothetical protein NX059_006403 [Plenodomus lindquistii]|nr:hypothetical protein NX059_006403 [Plenodomus lindquistii]
MVDSPIEVPPNSGGPVQLECPAYLPAQPYSSGENSGPHVLQLAHNPYTPKSWPTQAASCAYNLPLDPWLSDGDRDNLPYGTGEYAHGLAGQIHSGASQTSLRYVSSDHRDFVRPSDLELLPAGFDFNFGDGGTNERQPSFGFCTQTYHPSSQGSEQLVANLQPHANRTNTRSSRRKHIDIVKAWLHEHAFSPYPTPQQKKELSLETGLSTRELNVCLSNLRARCSPYSAKDEDADLVASDYTNSDTGMSAFFGVTGDGHQGLFAPWDAYSTDATGNAIHLSDSSSWMDLLEVNALATGPTGSPSSSPISSTHPDLRLAAQSTSTEVSEMFSRSALKRKGKRRHAPRTEHHNTPASLTTPLANTHPTTHNVINKYHCTACTRSFKDPYAWKRHESGVHGHIDTQWVCTLQEIILIDGKCIFCSDIVNDMAHFGQHGINSCYGEDKRQRTFSRKDGLKQHVLQKHLVTANDYIRKGFEPPQCWSEQAEMSLDARWCGFCLESFDNTPARMKHVAQHFKDGSDMVTWVYRATL